MKTFVLIIIVIWTYPAVTTQEFSSEKSCMTAKEKIENLRYVRVAKCVEK